MEWRRFVTYLSNDPRITSSVLWRAVVLRSPLVATARCR